MKSLTEIKERLNIYEIANALGIVLSKKNPQRSPFRADRNPSFSISKDGTLFNDFATQEKGDAIDFYKLATGTSTADSIKSLAQMCGLSSDNFHKRTLTPYKPPESAQAKTHAQAKASIQLPELYWNACHAKKLCNARGYCIEALKIAYDRGVFGFCEYKGSPAWLITDAAKKSAQARKLDGTQWQDAHNGHKAETLKNSECAYPIGLSAIDQRKHIVLCEGSTDFLAAFHFAYINDCENEIAPIAMLGATHRIGEEYLSAFNGKEILIFPDRDKAGMNALKIWGDQISKNAAKVLYFDFAKFQRIDGYPVKDLSDFIALDPDQWEAARPYTNPYYKFNIKGEI